MPFFSVIIPTYNRAAFLRESLRSVADQTFQDFETLVVDDGSSDDTETVVRSAGLPVQFLRQENGGPGAARNLGLAHAQGRYVAFLDSDDRWFPWTLESYHHTISTRRPSFISGVGLPCIQAAANPGEASRALDFRCYPNLLAACTGRVPPVGGTPSICLERQTVLRTGGFHAQRINGEDTDLWLRLGESPGFVRILNPPVFLQCVHNGNITRQIEPAIAGAWHLLRQERNHNFPGGRRYCHRRRRIICGTVRSVSLDCLNAGRVDEALRLYRASFWWNLELGNYKYLTGFPLMAAATDASKNREQQSCASTV